MKRITGLTITILALAFLSSQSAFASARTWGNTTGTDYNAAASWNAGAGPAPGAGDVGSFTAAEVTQPNLSASLSNAGVYFQGAASGGYDLTAAGGVSLTLTGTSTSGSNGTSNSTAAAIRSDITSGTNTVDAPLILAPATGTQSTFVQASGGKLIVNGAISSAAGINLSLRGGGEIDLNSSNSFSTASIDTANEVVVLGNDSALGSGTFTVGASSTISASSARILANPVVLSSGTGTIGGSNAITFNGSVTAAGAVTRTLTVNNSALTTFGNVFLSDVSGTGRTLVINGTGNATINGVVADFNGSGTAGTLSHGGTGTLTLNSANTYTGGTLMSGGLTIANHDGAFGSGSVQLSAANVTLTLQNGTLNNYIADSAAFSLFAGTDAVNLNYTGTDVVNTLSVAGVGEAAGVYGSATSGAPNVIAEFNGTGTITVLTSSAVPEPSTLAMIAIGAASLVGAQIRRKRS